MSHDPRHMMLAAVRMCILLAVGTVGFIYVCAYTGGLWPFGVVMFWPVARAMRIRIAEWVPLSLDDEWRAYQLLEE